MAQPVGIMDHEVRDWFFAGMPTSRWCWLWHRRWRGQVTFLSVEVCFLCVARTRR